METKPGYLTTEFWTTILVLASQVLNVTGIWDMVSNWHGGIIAAVVGAYNWSRGQAKSGVPYVADTRAGTTLHK